MYKNGFKEAGYFFDIFEGLKTGKKTFQFIVCRKTPVGKKLLNTNMKVSFGRLQNFRGAKNGFDFKVKFNLKQYRDYGTKTVNIKIAASKPKASAEPKRETNNSPARQQHRPIRLCVVIVCGTLQNGFTAAVQNTP